MHVVPINYWAILVSGIASMVLGFLWYGPLFGKTWTTMMGWGTMDPAKVSEMKKDAYKGYLVAFIGALVMGYVLAHSLIFAESYLNIYGISAGLQGGFWMWLGFVAPITLSSVLWDKKPMKLWLLNNSYNLLRLLMMGVILSLWK